MSNYFPLSNYKLLELVEKYGTPFYLYDEKAIVENIKSFQKAFSIFPNFKEYFAVKALPNPFIMKILKKTGCGFDCSKLAELILCEKIDAKNDNVIFTSNDTPANEFQYAYKNNNIINLDDITHIQFLKDALGGKLPDTICFRYNPGPLKIGGNSIIGEPEEAKFGLTYKQILQAYEISKKEGVKHFGLHTMVASNELNKDFFIDSAKLIFDLAVDIKKRLNIDVEFIDLGGGIGIPYKPYEKPVDISCIASGIKKLYDDILVTAGLKSVAICWECGRYITGPYGYLITKAIHEKHTYKEYIGVDASMADLMRPGMYGAYHEITISGKKDKLADRIYDIVGPLCENNDKFAISRKMPKIDINDILIIHDAGAHSRAMGFNYNGTLRCGEVLLREDGTDIEIRRKETIEDYFCTLDFDKLKNFDM